MEIVDCPNCRGVWLDRGEPDRIIERAPETTRRYGHADEGNRKKAEQNLEVCEKG